VATAASIAILDWNAPSSPSALQLHHAAFILPPLLPYGFTCPRPVDTIWYHWHLESLEGKTRDGLPR
jgi:hypothetical protein